MEDITKGWNLLSLSDQEGSGFHLREELASEEFILTAKFFTKRVLNTKSVARTFNQLWRSRNDLVLGDNIVLFIFDNKIRVDRVIANEPWSFDKHLVVLQRYDKDKHKHDLAFNQAAFWV